MAYMKFWEKTKINLQNLYNTKTHKIQKSYNLKKISEELIKILFELKPEKQRESFSSNQDFLLTHIFWAYAIHPYIFTNFAISPPIRTKYIPLGKSEILILADRPRPVPTDITFSPIVL